MANVAQLNMLSAKARAAGMEFDREANKDLTNDDIDELVRKFNANGGEYKPDNKETDVPQQKELNGQRFGMCYKEVTKAVGTHWKRENNIKFIGLVVDEYQLATKAEAAVSASLSISETKVSEMDAELKEVAATKRARDNGQIYVVCSYCGNPTQNPKSYQQATTLLCGKCAWFNEKDAKADADLVEDTDPRFLEAALDKIVERV